MSTAAVNFSSASSGLNKRELLALRSGALATPSVTDEKLHVLNSSLVATLDSMQRAGEERARLRESAEFMNEHDICAVAQASARLAADRNSEHASLVKIANEQREDTRNLRTQTTNEINKNDTSTGKLVDDLDALKLRPAEIKLAQEISDRTAAVALGLDGVMRNVERLREELARVGESRESEIALLAKNFQASITSLNQRLVKEAETMRGGVRLLGRTSDEKYDLLGERIAEDERSFDSKIQNLSSAIHAELDIQKAHAASTVRVTGEFLRDLEKNISDDTANINARSEAGSFSS